MFLVTLVIVIFSIMMATMYSVFKGFFLLQGVFGEYSSVVRKAVAALDQHITSTIQHISLPAIHLPCSPLEAVGGVQDTMCHTGTPHTLSYDTICFDTQTSDTKPFDGTDSTALDTRARDTLTACVSSKDLQCWTDHVTRLIDVRTTLVEAATGKCQRDHYEGEGNEM